MLKYHCEDSHRYSLILTKVKVAIKPGKQTGQYEADCLVQVANINNNKHVNLPGTS